MRRALLIFAILGFAACGGDDSSDDGKNNPPDNSQPAPDAGTPKQDTAPPPKQDTAPPPMDKKTTPMKAPADKTKMPSSMTSDPGQLSSPTDPQFDPLLNELCQGIVDWVGFNDYACEVDSEFPQLIYCTASSLDDLLLYAGCIGEMEAASCDQWAGIEAAFTPECDALFATPGLITAP